MALSRRYLTGVLASGISALLWATFFPLVLVLPSSENVAIMFVAPLFGAAASLGLRAAVPSFRSSRPFRRVLVDHRVLAVAILWLIVQALIVLGTRFTGAIDTSILILSSDVLGTPLIFYGLMRGGGGRFRRLGFWAGVVIIGAGALLTILGGGTPEPLSLLTILLGAPLFFGNSFLVISIDRTGRTVALADLMAAAMILMCGIGLLGAALLLRSPDLLGSWDPRYILVLAVMGILNFSVAPLAFFWAAQRITLIVPSVLQSAIPVFTLIFILVLGLQPVTVLAVVGVPIAFLGAAIAALTPGTEPPLLAPVP
jgi:drug/metabolite transporter (DMT)-like permease